MLKKENEIIKKNGKKIFPIIKNIKKKNKKK